MFVYTHRHGNARRVHGRNTRAANVYSFTRERYHNNKYKNSPYYKVSLPLDKLPINVRQCVNLIEFKTVLNQVFVQCDDSMS